MNKLIGMILVSLLLIALVLPARPVQAGEWQSVEKVLGLKGVEQGELFKITLSRTDLNVTVQGIPLDPGLALTSWFAFKPLAKGTLLLGKLVLLDEEVPKALDLLTRNGFQITALGNRFLNESPRIRFVGIAGEGSRANLARALKVVLSLIPQGPEGGAGTTQGLSAQPTGSSISATTPSPNSPLRPPGSEGQGWSKIEGILGPGQTDGKLLSYDFSRAEAVTEKGVEIPPFMGIATSLHFQKVTGLSIGKKGFFGFWTGAKPSKDIVAAAGDFVLSAEEVGAVVKTLILHRITVTAIDRQMTEETPRLFFLHFWGLGTPEEVASGLKAALDQVHLAGTK